MITIRPDLTVLVAAQPVDFRKGMDALAGLVAERLSENPYTGTIFVFRSKRADRVKILAFDGTGLILATKRLEEGRFTWPPIQGGVVRLTAAQFSMLVDGLDWVRRETGRRQRVQVPYDEGGAIHIDPESCAGGREAAREALTGARVGQPWSGERHLHPSADALQSAEGHTSRRVIASAGRLGVVVRPWHARTSSAREPRDLRFARASRATGRTVKAGSRRP